MEITELYIKMCDCPEIQEDWPVNSDLGDYYHDKRDGEVYIVGEDEMVHCNILNGTIRLLRQDQLQVLLRQFYSDDPDLTPKRPGEWFPVGYIGLTFVLRAFHEFAVPRGSGAHVAYDVKSFEELWLRFYMWEAYGKTYFNGKWHGSTKREIPITPTKGSDGHKEKMAEINKRLKDPDAGKKQRKNLEEMKKLGSG